MPGTGETMVKSDSPLEGDAGSSASTAALQQCEVIQDMIDISISSLQGLRTKCAASNDLTQQEIRTLEASVFFIVEPQRRRPIGYYMGYDLIWLQLHAHFYSLVELTKLVSTFFCC